MKISELIASLEQRKEEFGDVDVRVWNAAWSEYYSGIEVSESLCNVAAFGEFVPQFLPVSGVQ